MMTFNRQVCTYSRLRSIALHFTVYAVIVLEVVWKCKHGKEKYRGLEYTIMV
jgi:hypothetical protein